MIIAIDGPAASGKGTLGRRLAEYFDCAHLDTGKLYRMVATNVLRSGGNPADPADALAAARALDPSRLDAPELDSDETARAASLVAAIPEVRDVLRGLQQAFAKMPPDGAVGAVLDGRDIGTVICPDADIKFFVTATVEARAERRHKELKNLGKDSIYARVLQDLKERDTRDATRNVAPLKLADDAIVLDTTGLDADGAFDLALDHIRSRASSA